MDQVSADEAFARQLFEQEEKEHKAAYQRDLELAKQLQNDDLPVDLSQHSNTSNKTTLLIDLTTEGDDVEHHRDNYDVDLELAKQLDLEWNHQPASSSSEHVTSNQLQNDFFLAKQLDQELAKQVEMGITKETETDIMNATIPDLHELFLLFNQKYFYNQLDTVEVKWSTRMTRCAGTCTFRTGGHCYITMSEPLLKFRPKSDMINTLLHEMIHALLFLTQRNTDRDGHGPEFLKEADRINKLANSNITVYHNFHDEVDHYLTHVWQCNGICRGKPPYFGIVKRSMNRPPQPADTWFEEHQRTCGGTYTKISEPEGYSNKRKKTTKPSNSIQNYFDTNNKKPKIT